jgi:hypothetical protein
VGARGGAWARACTCAYMRNARTFAASASSWSTRARRIAFSSSTAAEEGSEGEEEGGEEDEEEGGEEDEEERGEEEDELLAPLLLDFLLCFPPPPPAPSPIARLPRLRAASLLGGALVAGQRRGQSSVRARAAAAREYAPCFPFVTRHIGVLLPASGTLPAPSDAHAARETNTCG